MNGGYAAASGVYAARASFARRSPPGLHAAHAPYERRRPTRDARNRAARVSVFFFVRHKNRDRPLRNRVPYSLVRSSCCSFNPSQKPPTAYIDGLVAVGKSMCACARRARVCVFLCGRVGVLELWTRR